MRDNVKHQRRKKSVAPSAPTDEQAFHAFVYAGFADHINRLANVMARAIAANGRLKEQGNPKPTPPPAEHLLTKDEIRRVLTEDQVHVGAGKDKSKENRITALTLVELLYNAKLVDMRMLCAADRFREMHLEREGPSHGVGSYGNNPGQADPARKADRAGRALTGYDVSYRGKWKREDETPRRTNSYDYEAAMLAMCGVIDSEGRRVHDEQLVRIMVSAVTKTTDVKTQTSIAKDRTRYRGEKQMPPAGATVVTEALRRLTLHFQYGG